MQIIDLGSSGIHFAESGVINLGSRGSGIQLWMPTSTSTLPTEFLLLETGDFLLLETGDKLGLET